jgi:hypothetical protein
MMEHHRAECTPGTTYMHYPSSSQLVASRTSSLAQLAWLAVSPSILVANGAIHIRFADINRTHAHPKPRWQPIVHATTSTACNDPPTIQVS